MILPDNISFFEIAFMIVFQYVPINFFNDFLNWLCILFEFFLQKHTFSLTLLELCCHV